MSLDGVVVFADVVNVTRGRQRARPNGDVRTPCHFSQTLQRLFHEHLEEDMEICKEERTLGDPFGLELTCQLLTIFGPAHSLLLQIVEDDIALIPTV